MKNGKIGVTTENIFPVIKKFLYSDHEIFLRELVSNAVDATQKLRTLASTGVFAGETGELAVRIAVDKEARTLSVTDNGIGIPEKYSDRIFERFYRVDKSRSSKTGGTGLGLSIVKHIVEMYNGDIEVESEVFVGTKFLVKLPYQTVS